MTKTIVLSALLALLTAGCYTKLYRPGDEPMGQRGPYEQIYNRYDSTAIDTTLTEPETVYPPDDYGWYNWGHSRYPRWGFDFWNFYPGYYWTYDGFYDYYGTPWWYRYNDLWYPGWAPPAGPAEPPSQRDFGRRDRGSSGGSPAAPPPSGGGYTPQSTPAPSPPPQQKPSGDAQKQQNPPPQDDQNRRSGRRGR